jgi:membrane protein
VVRGQGTAAGGGACVLYGFRAGAGTDFHDLPDRASPRDGDAEDQILNEVRDLVGRPGAEAIRGAIESVRGAGGAWTTSVGVLTLLFGLWGVFGELQDALNTIWGVTTKPGRGAFGVIKERFWSVAMVVGIGFLLLVSLVVSAWLVALGTLAQGVLSGPLWLLNVANTILSFLVTTFMFAVIYKLLPDVRIAWRNLWIGAAVTALLFTFGKSLIGFYLGHSAVASSYGAAGSLVVILLWIYFSAQIVFLGAEFVKVYSRRFGTRVVPELTAVPLTDDARASQGMDRSKRIRRIKRARR